MEPIAVEPISVLVVDDSGSARALICALLEDAPGLRICGEAENGREAVEKVLSLKPNIVTMDLQMPEMDGMAAIEEIMAVRATPILVLSDLADARNAMLAVERGALEATAKPTIDDGCLLAARLKMLARVPVIRHIRRGKAQAPPHISPQAAVARAPHAFEASGDKAAGADQGRVFAIASSTGGPQALASLLPALPADFPSPVLIAQHISEGFAEAMASWLNDLCPLSVAVARAGESPRPGWIYLADPSTHMTISSDYRIQLTPCVESDIYHPNCDRLLASVAEVCGHRAVGVILTGMGRDGARGMLDIRRAGGMTIGQDEESSVIFGMNREAILAGAVQSVLPLNAIAKELGWLARTAPVARRAATP
ncbi:chemotaxis-specific protein-glutamate methyltransferase CheB [Thiorhodococcus mannitoliphagus]|uniref:Protein-glutamate methylesterase/protein-glutamine glutaminase n=1 Tax=Thiorhodococcus mannitoliphagus TaxID=329406 RepID=A0A6P1DZQ3_9GAMM|nr:chemotaxis-specific protein-glutamate methyltransferase CheB [Thiorhodococcus mannitoliphagus]NEX21005.1 chemotaxis-specific protein-glutamate methyltransferase CheB [Thiorhodococcus mannitoliphagus]